MTWWLILLIILVSIVAYALIGAVVGGLAWKIEGADQTDALIVGILWPVMLIPIIALIGSEYYGNPLNILRRIAIFVRDTGRNNG